MKGEGYGFGYYSGVSRRHRIDKKSLSRVETLVTEIIGSFGISRATFCRWIKEREEVDTFWQYKRLINI